MSGLFASGRVVDFILVLTAIEAIWVARTRRDLLPTLAAGACLMVALRGALTGAWWGWIGLCLVASLAAHVADLWQRKEKQ